MSDKQYKILIIDDDPFLLDMYVLKFKEQRYVLETASNGKEGLEKAKTFLPDLVLLDVVMPGMDGFEILRELKKDESSRPLKVVLLTNLGQKEDVERGLQLGANDYIIKAHFTPGEVLAKVKEILKD